MCGIFGCFSNHNLVKNENVRQAVVSIGKNIRFRGPDNFQVLTKEKSIFGHCRLNIIDNSASSNQPISTNSTLFAYNGEFYTYRDFYPLREDLKSSDCLSFHQLIIDQGPIEAARQIDGMFAFAFYDTKQETLFLGRDVFGMKPLYIAEKDSKIYFSSEIKPLLDLFDKDIFKELDYDNYLSFGTLDKSKNVKFPIRQVQKGHVEEFKFINSKIKSKSTSIHPTFKQRHFLAKNKNKCFEKLFLESLDNHLNADYSICLFLSGGLDSSSILLGSFLLNKKFDQTYTVRFSNQEFDEGEIAKRFCEIMGFDNKEIFFGAEDFLKYIEKSSSVFGSPFSDPAQLPLMKICEIAKDDGYRVALSGDGGDELFGGYSHYFSSKKMILIKDFLENFSFSNLEKLASFFIEKKYPRYGDASRFIELLYILLRYPQDEIYRRKFSFFGSSIAQDNKISFDYSNGPTKIRDMMKYDLSFYLEDTILKKSDRVSMRNSIELRLPFLTKSLLEYSVQCEDSDLYNNGKGKLLLRKFLSSYLPNNLIERKKRGFGLPLKQWFKNDLQFYIEEQLFDSDNDLFNSIVPKYILRELLDAHINDRSDQSKRLFHALILSKWCKYISQTN